MTIIYIFELILWITFSMAHITYSAIVRNKHKLALLKIILSLFFGNQAYDKFLRVWKDIKPQLLKLSIWGCACQPNLLHNYSKIFFSI